VSEAWIVFWGAWCGIFFVCVCVRERERERESAEAQGVERHALPTGREPRKSMPHLALS